MPHEAWLLPNQRPAIAVLAACAVVFVAAVVGVAAGVRSQSGFRLFAAVAAAVVGISAVAVGVVVSVRAARPRVYRQNGEVMFRLRSDRPIAVPIAVVEAFFLGQGPARLPAAMGKQLESVNLVARLSERATQWHSQAVDPRLAAWCDGYITIRGTYCEPISIDLVHRLNRRLADAKRDVAGGA